MSDRVSKKQIGIGRRIGDLYVVESLHLPLSTSPAALSSFQLDSQSTTIKLLRSDLGGEYFKTEFCEYLANLGTIHQTSCTDTPAQNGRAERKHRHLLETARSLLLSASVPAPFWGEAVLTAAFLLNRMPTPLLSGRSPYEALFSQPPNYSLLRVFGSACFVLLPRKDRTKLSARSVIAVMTLFLVAFMSPAMLPFSNVYLTFSFLLSPPQFPKRIWFILIHFLLRSHLMSTSPQFLLSLFHLLLLLHL
ncbi:hypothetical protein CsSME_00007039 [Camellia sinensis var. sinensis]